MFQDFMQKSKQKTPPKVRKNARSTLDNRLISYLVSSLLPGVPPRNHHATKFGKLFRVFFSPIIIMVLFTKKPVAIIRIQIKICPDQPITASAGNLGIKASLVAGYISC